MSRNPVFLSVFLHVSQEASADFFASSVFFMYELADSWPGCCILFKNKKGGFILQLALLRRVKEFCVIF